MAQQDDATPAPGAAEHPAPVMGPDAAGSGDDANGARRPSGYVGAHIGADRKRKLLVLKQRSGSKTLTLLLEALVDRLYEALEEQNLSSFLVHNVTIRRARRRKDRG